MEPIARNEMHPLDNPLILERIFEHLALDDLLSCRQVCRQWRQSSATAMLETAVTTVYSDNAYRGMLHFVIEMPREHSHFEQHPFLREFNIDNYKDELPGFGDPPRFWDFCGRHIKILNIKETWFTNTESFLLCICQSCPNLEEFFIEDCEVHRDNSKPNPELVPGFPRNLNLTTLDIRECSIPDDCLTQLIAHFPSMQNLILILQYYKIDTVLKCLKTLRQENPDNWDLKMLTFDFSQLLNPLESLSFFEYGIFSFEDLTIWKIALPRDANVVKRILMAQRSSLKELLFCQDTQNSIPLEFPFENYMLLKNVCDLYLNMNLLNSFNFLTSFPNLRKFHFEFTSDFAIPNTNLSETFELAECTEIELNVRISTLEPENWSKFFSWFPNMETLKIDGAMENRFFSWICENCTKLIALHIETSRIDYCGISGLDSEDVERINRDYENGVIWRPITVPRPNIASLKHLTKFSWESVTPRKLTYCTAAFGVQLMPQLKHLRVSYTDDQLFMRLKTKFPWKE